jgi:15-cis-phytoene synthase
MKVSIHALCAFLAMASSASAFLGPLPSHHRLTEITTTTRLQSLAAPASPPGKSKDSSSSNSFTAGTAEDMVSSGRILEGGKVIDFESVKGPSRAEQALVAAKNEIAEGTFFMSSPGILGINDDVIKEVGHDLGMFATTGEVQGVAAYLRSKAPAGLLRSLESPPTHHHASSSSGMVNGAAAVPSFSAAEIARYKEILRKAYVESGEVTSAFAKTFYMGTQLLPEAPREAIWAIYVWCRRTDEIVDAPRDNDEEMLRDLGSWETRLEDLFNYGKVVDVFDLCLLDVLVRYPNLSITPFMDMVRGMLMDVPELGQEVYESFDELHLYCYRVAGTVGLMSLPIFGCAKGYTDAIAK